MKKYIVTEEEYKAVKDAQRKNKYKRQDDRFDSRV